MTHVLSATAAPDPIHAAIARHRAAFDALQAALEGTPAIEANDEYDAAGEALVTTACATRFGTLALLGHLRWWLAEEAEFAAGHRPAYGIALARAADLSLFLGVHAPPVAIGTALPMGRLPPPHHATGGRRLAQVAVLAGEAVTAVAIVAGGAVLTGLASLL